jgi:DNA uptake protein ComE-like DNA-binding protein
LKEKTAETTATLKRDTKAIAEGVKEGLSRKESVNLNKASKADLQGLPGVTPQRRTESSPSGLTPVPANW